MRRFMIAFVAALAFALAAGTCGQDSPGDDPGPDVTDVPGSNQTGTEPPPGGGVPERFEIAPAFPRLSFEAPTLIAFTPPDSANAVVLEQAGRILTFPNNQQADEAMVLLDLSDRVKSGGEEGLLGLAFDPGYATTDIFMSTILRQIRAGP